MNRTEILANYEAASAAADAAFLVFDPIRSAFRSGKVSADEYLAARTVYEAVKADFDVAFAAAADLPEEDDAEILDNSQLALFA